MTLIPSHRKARLGQSLLTLGSAVCAFVAGLVYFDSDFPWYWRLAGIIGLLAILIIVLVWAWGVIWK